MALKVMTDVMHGISHVFSAGTAAHAIHKVLTNQRKSELLSKLRVAAEGTFMMMNLGEAVFDTGVLKPSIALETTTHVTNSVSDVAREALKITAEKEKWSKDDYLDFALLLGLKTTEMLEFVSKRQPEVLRGYDGEAREVASIVGSTLSIARQRRIIIEGYKAYLVYRNKVYIYNKKQPTEEEGKVTASQTEPLLAKGRQSSDKVAELSAFKSSPLACHAIPDQIILKPDEWSICKITGHPIRFICVPKLSEELLDSNDKLADIRYDKEAIEKWINEKPNEAPPEWPIEHLPLPLMLDYIKVDRRLQVDLNRKLQAIAEDLVIDVVTANDSSSTSTTTSDSSSSSSSTTI